MADDKDDKVTGVKGKSKAGGIDPTKAVTDVEQVQSVDEVKAVGDIKAAQAIKKATELTPANRESMMKLISEEADKLFESGLIPKEQRAVVEQAVKMAVDAAIIEEDDEDEDE